MPPPLTRYQFFHAFDEIFGNPGLIDAVPRSRFMQHGQIFCVHLDALDSTTFEEMEQGTVATMVYPMQRFQY
jgi:hypothetical protein